MTVRFLSPASREIKSAFEYYENERNGLGKEFIFEVDFTIEIIKEHPQSWPEFKKDIRGLLFEGSRLGCFTELKMMS